MTKERIDAVNKIKEMLTTAPILFHPDFEKPFKLYVDASIEGLGAALHQTQIINGKPKEGPIVFISRKLTNTESRYSSPQLEALALVWALEKLHYYLDGSYFEVITDCTGVRSLTNLKSPSRHMLRWMMAIQEYKPFMTITHRPGKFHNNADGLSRMALPNDSDNPAWEPEEMERDIPVMGISLCELSDEFFEEVKDSYEKNSNTTKLVRILSIQKTDLSLITTLEQPWKDGYDQGKITLESGLLYFREKHSAVLIIVKPEHIQQTLHVCHDEFMSGHLSDDRTVDRIRNTAWWPSWRKDVEEYVKTCERCQKANKATGKRFGLLQRIEEPTYPWEVINMDFVTGLPPSSINNYNCVLVIVDRFSKRTRFLPCYKESTAMDIALLFWERIISDVGLPRVIISDRDPKFTSEFWKSLNLLIGTTLAMSTAYHPQTDGLSERNIGTLTEIVRRYCTEGLSYTDKDGFTHDWHTLLPALELAYNSSIHSTTGKKPFEIERGYCPRLPKDQIKNKNIEFHPTSLSFFDMLNKARARAAQCIEDAVTYNQERWNKTHKEPKFVVGEQVLLSTTNFTNLQGPKKLQDQFVGPFVILKFHGSNAVEVALTEEFGRKHPVFPISLIKKYHASDKSKFPDREIPKQAPIQFETDGEKIFSKIIKQRETNTNGKPTTLYLVRYKNRSADEDEWLPADKVPNGKTTLREFRAQKRAQKLPEKK
jgi:hypothetical protein